MLLPFQFLWVALALIVAGHAVYQVGNAPDSRRMMVGALKGMMWIAVVYAIGSVGLFALAQWNGEQIRVWHGGH